VADASLVVVVAVVAVVVVVLAATVLVVAGGALVEVWSGDGWCAVVASGVFVEFVRVNTSTRSSRGLDHITRWALRKEYRWLAMVLAG